MDRAQEGDLVESLYDAALGQQSWELLGQRLRDYMGARTLMLSTHDPNHVSANVVLTLGLTPRAIQEYVHFAPHDLWALGALNRRMTSAAVNGNQVVADQELLQSYIYNEYLKPQVDVRYMVGALLPLQGGNHAVVGIHRPHDAQDFTGDDTERLNRLLPHLRRALEIRQRLDGKEGQYASVRSTLDRLSSGVIVMSQAGRLIHVNSAGEEILRSADGLQRSSTGLRAQHNEDDKRLQQLITGMGRHSADGRCSGGHLRIRRKSGKSPYAVMVSPVGPGLVGADTASRTIAIFVTDPEQAMLNDLTMLKDLFSFSPAEGRLVTALMSGKQLPEIAEEAGVSYNTLRTQLSRAMSRTGTRSQVELVMLVAKALKGLC